MSKLLKALRLVRSQGVGALVEVAYSRLPWHIKYKLHKPEFLDFGIRMMMLRWAIETAHGPSKIDYATDDLTVTCVVRNGEAHLTAFLAHYRRLGVKHFFFLDNGSTDGTVTLLCRQNDVTVLRADVPYSKYENSMKRFLVRRFCWQRWTLLADIDELFTYPYADRINLRSFIRYLDSHGFNAAICQLLDMFPPRLERQRQPQRSFVEDHTFYDISDIRKIPYPGHDEMMMHYGGIRKTVFRTDNCLTKVSLIKVESKLKPFVEWHQARGAKLADVSCVLLHYPFLPGFFSKVADAVRTGRYGFHTSDEYKAYAKVLEEDREVVFSSPSAQRLVNSNDLVRAGFLTVSERYEGWLRDLQVWRNAPPTPPSR